MSHPTCPCCASLGRCGRCDLLVGMEGLHMIALARRESGLVLDIESCDPVAGCPGCGVIAQGHGRGGQWSGRALARPDHCLTTAHAP